MLSETITIPSPWQVMSLARVKLSLTRIAQVPSRLGRFGVGEDATVADGLAAATPVALEPGDGCAPGF
jgi:hypothetical protein